MILRQLHKLGRAFNAFADVLYSVKTHKQSMCLLAFYTALHRPSRVVVLHYNMIFI